MSGKLNITVIFIGWFMVLGACSAGSKQTKNSAFSYVIDNQRYHVLSSAKGFTQQGLASWYGDDFNGLPTASGEVYDMYANTAAHRTLPFGTTIKVTNLSNNQSVLVKVNDRGPFVEGRILDLSYASASKLDMLETGVEMVRIEALAAESSGDYDFQQGKFSIQIGAFKQRENAQKLADSLANSYIVIYESPNGRFYRVRVGHHTNLQEAYETCRELESNGFHEAFVIAE
jgi:rare lipoprotein A